VSEDEAHQVFDAQTLIAAQATLRRMPVGEAVMDLILDLVRSCRPGQPDAPDIINQNVSWGPGPRAAQSLMLTVRAKALLDGRLAPSPQDVVDMAGPVLTHRMALTFAARARGEDLSAIIRAAAEDVTRIEAAA
jgi:MoxR-like ATPase